MEATRLSTLGQVVIPKELRDAYRWGEGQELDVIDTGNGILLKVRKPHPKTAWANVAGSLRHLARGNPPVTDEQIQAAVRAMAARSHGQSRAENDRRGYQRVGASAGR